MASTISGEPVIYKITSGNSVFIGATTNIIKKRKVHTGEIANVRRGEAEPKNFLYQTIAENNFEWKMEIYKEFPCETRKQLNAESDRIANEISADINANIDRKHKPNFANAVIYTITTGDTTYVGSTTNFAMRKRQHGQNIVRGDKKSKLYQTIKNNNNEWNMKIHSRVQCSSSEELRAEEEKLRAKLNAELNSIRASKQVGDLPLSMTKEEANKEKKTPNPKDKTKTIYLITAKRYAFIAATHDFEAEKQNHIDGVAVYRSGQHPGLDDVVYQWISGADYEWDIQPYSEFAYDSKTEPISRFHDHPDIEAEFERIRLLLDASGDYDYVDTRALRILHRRQYLTIHCDPAGWKADVGDLPHIPEHFYDRRSKFYQFNGDKVFWASRHMRCPHFVEKHNMCHDCFQDPRTDKKAYWRKKDFYELVEEKRFRKHQWEGIYTPWCVGSTTK